MTTIRKTELNLLNTIDKWQRHGGFTTNTIVVLPKKDSDSELSVLTTSLFNGMEGIEIGSGSGSEIQGYIGSNNTVFGSDSKV